MHAWKHVFVHVDARPHAPYALSKALAIAEAFDGRVTAFDSVSAADGLPSLSSSYLHTDRVLDLAVAARSHALRETLARLEPRVPVDSTVVKGPSADALLRHAEDNHADLIIKAVSAADVGQRTPAGTATLRLIREALVPVWVSSPHRRRTGRVLAAVNFANAKRASEHAVRAGARVAWLRGAELHVLCVDDLASRHLPEIELSATPQPLEHEAHELRRALEELKRGSAPPPNATQSVVLETIEKAVFDLEPDIVVLSRDGSDLSGLAGTHLVERLFCRIESSMLLLPPELGTRKTVRPLDRRALAAMTERHAHAGVV